MNLAHWTFASLAVAIAACSVVAGAGATGPYSVPLMSRVEGTVPLSPDIHQSCLVRADTAGSDVDTRSLCYESYKPDPPPSLPPSSFIPANHLAVSGALVGDTLLLPVLNCTEISPGGLAVSFAIGIELDKAGNGTGSNVIKTDTTSPFNCADGTGTTTTTGPLTLTPLASNHNEDSAEAQAVLGIPDPCTDFRELGDTPTAGGLRDPFNPYDFYEIDDPTSSDPEELDYGAITIGDVFEVSGRMGQTPSDPEYEPRFDRGPGLGPNGWNVGPPDGGIALGDVFNIAGQYGHSCV